MAGYSKTPLLKKLGIKPNFTMWVLNPPPNYFSILGDLPENVQIKTASGDDYNFIHIFTKAQSELSSQILLLKSSLAKDGMLWISWPKKAAKTTTDLDGNIVRQLGLDSGLVDIKVAAIDDIWSGLKFVFRKEDR